jgi:hypothetical protein
MLIVGSFCEAAAKLNMVAKRHTTDAPVMSIAAADINGDGKTELITGRLDNKIVALSLEGKELWTCDVPGIPLAMSVGDTNADGKKEIAAAVQDTEGLIYVLDHKGRVKWSYRSDFAFLCVDVSDTSANGTGQVAAGDLLGSIHLLSGEGKLNWKKKVAASSVGALRIGDVDNDRRPELVAGTRKNGVVVMNSQGKVVWKKNRRMKGIGKSLSAEAKMVRSIAIEDLDLDGTSEIIVGSRPNSMVSVFSGRGEVIWQKRFPKIMNNWSTSIVGIGNVVGDSKKEIVVLLHGIVWGDDNATSPIFVLDCKGEPVGDSRPRVNFYSFFVDNTNKSGRARVLTTSPTRGHYFYSLSVSQSSSRVGDPVIQRPPDHIDDLIKELGEAPGGKRTAEGSSGFHVLYSCSVTDPDMDNKNKFFSSLETNNLSFEFIIKGVFEKAVVKNFSPRFLAPRKLRTQAEILELMEALEKKRIPFFLHVGQWCRLHISLETVRKILSTAPKYCQGLIVNEDSFSHGKRWDKWVFNIESLLTLCKDRKKKVILSEHQDFWLRTPLFDDVSRKLFRQEFSDVLVPMYKTNRCFMPELNIGTILGLWKAGRVNQWGFSTQDDVWRWESMFIVPPHDVLLRMELMAASLGATYFRVEKGKEFLEERPGVISLSAGAKRHRGLFYKLIGKDIVRPISDSTQVVTSPVMLRHIPWTRWRRPKRPGDQFMSIYASAKEGHVFGFQYLFQKTYEDYVSRMVYGLDTYVDAMLPETPYGYVGIVPNWVDEKAVSGVQKYLTTDGHGIIRGKRKLDFAQAKREVVDSFEKGARSLPFRAEGVFLSAQKFDKEYVVYLMAPGCLDIADINTELHISESLKNCVVSDAISGNKLTIKNGKVAVRVPAGTFRILRVALVPDSQAQ